MSCRIRTIFLLLAALSAGFCHAATSLAQDGDILTAIIPGGHQLVLPYFPDMDAKVHAADERMLTVSVRTRSGFQPMSLKLTFIENRTGRAPSRQQSRDMVARMAEPHVADSVEGEIGLWEIDTQLGPAILSTLNDRRYAGRPAPHGEYSTISVGQIVTNDIGVAITLLTNGVDTEVFDQALGIVGAFLVVQAEAALMDMPTPPAGYQWEACPEIMGALLRPDGWYFRKHIEGDKRAYFVTKEDIGADGEFTTCLTMVALIGYGDSKGVSAAEFAKSYVINATNSSHVRKAPWTNRMGPFVAHGVILTTPDFAKGDFVSHHLVIANEDTSTVYIVIFESPVEDWAAMKALSEPMLKQLYIDSDI